MDDDEDLEGNEEDTEAEDETFDDESGGDPKDGNYNPEGDGFVEDSPQEMARQILRDVQAQPAADQRRVVVETVQVAEAAKTAAGNMQENVNPQTQPAVKPKQQLNTVPAPTDMQTARVQQ